MIKYWPVLAIVCGVLIGFLISPKKTKTCDTIVFIEGELSIDATDVIFLQQGNMCRIELCGGTQLTIPSSRVIKIIDKSDVQ
jgi:hypothetical protein